MNKYIFLILFFTVTPVYAYLDAGTGTAIFQGIVGALAALAITFKLYWYRILRFLGIKKKPEIQDDITENQDEK